MIKKKKLIALTPGRSFLLSRVTDPVAGFQNSRPWLPPPAIAT